MKSPGGQDQPGIRIVGEGFIGKQELCPLRYLPQTCTVLVLNYSFLTVFSSLDSLTEIITGIETNFNFFRVSYSYYLIK